ncbi:EscU/YscU/HrcU family type III secretion system export apparatus switch protein [Singulisphaera sp. PoT]|uniref:EscU/YscU/HrcU family type III secretion system export apparatus switch protein n=1 Tax=Singulisphaera sp. PoT TaxID=3411797 RepID=UPI003BF596D4
MSDAEERTQSPSKLRREQARESGQVAQSAELTGAAALFAAVLLLGARGDQLALTLIGMLRAPLLGDPMLLANPDEVVARLRGIAFELMAPLGILAVGSATAAILAHQAQVRGLFVPGLLAPDPSRLWTLGRGPGFATRSARGAWSVAKAVVVVAVAAWAIRSGWLDYLRLADSDTQRLARAVGEAMRRLALYLAGSTLALGLVDFGLQHRRYEAMLQMTPEESREDQRSMEGDPALRARRRRLARSWRNDSAEILAGATLMLTGPSGLTLILAGGPPPRRPSIRSALKGAAGLKLREAALQAKLPTVAAPDLAYRLATRPAPALPLSAEQVAELAAIWPVESPRGEA